MSNSDRVDLRVQVGALRLANPVIAASGTFDYGLEFDHLVGLDRQGGFVTNGISLELIEGAPAPHLFETPSRMLNAVGSLDLRVAPFVKGKLLLLQKYNTNILINVFGYTMDDCAEVIRRLEDVPAIATYELNTSSRSVEKGGPQFRNTPDLVAEVEMAARKATRQRPFE